MSPPIRTDQGVFKSPGGGEYPFADLLRAARKYRAEKLEQRAMSETSNDFQKVKLSARDWVIALTVVIANTVAVIGYIEHRFAALEQSSSQHERDITDLRADRNATNAKLDKINETLTNVQILLARQGSKP